MFWLAGDLHGHEGDSFLRCTHGPLCTFRQRRAFKSTERKTYTYGHGDLHSAHSHSAGCLPHRHSPTPADPHFQTHHNTPEILMSSYFSCCAQMGKSVTGGKLTKKSLSATQILQPRHPLVLQSKINPRPTKRAPANYSEMFHCCVRDGMR